jgi:hypothetical protein
MDHPKLTIVSVVTIVLTYLFRVVFKEWLKDLQDRITAADSLFRTELSASALEAQLTAMKIDQDNAMGSALAKAKRTKDYSQFILKERMAVMKRRAELGSMEEGTMRLIKALPRNALFLKSFVPIQEEVKKQTGAAIEAEKASSVSKDWGESAKLQIHIMQLAFTQIQVAVFAGEVMKRATEVREAAEILNRKCNQIGYFLYALGLALAVYANLKGIKTVIGGE